MLEEGVTATWGAVTEPFANFYAAGGNVFDHLWSGYNFGESFYIAQNTVNWVMTAVGDPLYAPKSFAILRWWQAHCLEWLMRRVFNPDR